MNIRMTLYYPLGADTILEYKRLCFFTPNKTNFKEKGTSI